MPGKQAKILAPAALEQMLEHVGGDPYPDRARAIILLSAKAGLRAKEIAGLTWDMVLDEVILFLVVDWDILMEKVPVREVLHDSVRA